MRESLRTGKLLESGLVRTPMFYLSFPEALFKAVPFMGGQAKFGITMLFDLNLVDFTIMQAHLDRAVVKKFGKLLKLNPAKNGWHDATEKEYDGYTEGRIYAPARSERQPMVIDAGRNVLYPDAPQIDNIIYPGVRCVAIVDSFAYTREGINGVSFGLRSLQVIGGGERLGGSAPIEPDEHEDLSDEADEAGTSAEEASWA